MFLAVGLAFTFTCRAEQTTSEEEYARQGTDAAAALLVKFDAMEKPKFQQAYDDYLKDLEIIAETGRAADNPEPLKFLISAHSKINKNDCFSPFLGHF